MSDQGLFSSEFAPPHTRFRMRLWGADLLDLGTAALLGWGTARALDLEQTPGVLLATMACAWLVLSLVGGVRGWTLGRRLLGVRLVTDEGHAPGPLRSLARAPMALPDLLATPLLPARPLDRILKLRAERGAQGLGPWLRGVAGQLPWVAALVAAAWFIVTPTKKEALVFLDLKLQGWRCCHGSRKANTWQCRSSIDRVVREARSQDPEALAVVADCPVAAERARASR